MAAHRDDTGQHKSLEEAVLENIDQAAASIQAPVQGVFNTVVNLKRVVIAGIIFVLAFSTTTVYALIRVDEVADQNQQYLVDGCEAGNESRASELGFWLTLFEITANDPESKTKVEQARRKIYLDKLYKTYPQVDCTKVKQGKRVELPTVKVEKPIPK